MKEYIVAVPDHLAGDLFRGDPELIRCKDCKWNDGGEWVDCYMSGMHGRTSNKNYCSRAERKEE